MTALPWWAWAVSVTGVVGMLGALVLALPRRHRLPVAAGLAGWVALTVLLAAGGWFVQGPDQAVPWIGPTIVVAVLLASWVLHRTASAAPDAALTAVQGFRVVGGVFVALWVVGELPPQFALPAGLGDVAIGIAALVVARRLRRGETRGAVTFHVLGILDLVVAVATGFLAAPGPYGVLAGAVTTAPMTVPPLSLVPTTLVPLSVAMHWYLLGRLRRPALATVDA